MANWFVKVYTRTIFESSMLMAIKPLFYSGYYFFRRLQYRHVHAVDMCVLLLAVL